MEIQRIGHDYPKALAVSFALICGTFGAVILTRTCPDLPPDAAVVSSIYDHLLDDTPTGERSGPEWGEELRRALESSAHAKKYVLTQEAPPADAWLARFGFFTDGAMQLLAFESPRELFFAVHPDGSCLLPEEYSPETVTWSWWLCRG